MPRVTDLEVKGIISNITFDTTPFIDTANVIVNEYLMAKIPSTALLTKIELYLAAHFVAITAERGGIVRSSFMDAAESYADVYKTGFRSTRYGQQALALDFTATLNAISADKLTARFRVV